MSKRRPVAELRAHPSSLKPTSCLHSPVPSPPLTAAWYVQSSSRPTLSWKATSSDRLAFIDGLTPVCCELVRACPPQLSVEGVRPRDNVEFILIY